jgi:PAS domain S-box-containing protein
MALYKHQIEGKLRDSEENFRALAENAYDGILIINNQGRLLFANKRAAEITGYSNEELLNTSIYDLSQKDEHDNLKIDIKNPVWGNENSPYETYIVNKDSSHVPIEMTGSRTIWHGENAEILIIRDIRDRKQTEKHMQKLLKQEKLLTDELKVVNAYLTQTKDELEKTVKKLKFSNRELEQFAYIASHDLQEPLRMVSSFTQLLEMKYGDKLDNDAKEYIGFAVDGAKQMEVLINDLLAYSRVTSSEDQFTEINMEKILDEVIFNMEFIIRDNHVVITRDPLPSIYGDYSQIKQVIQNLLGNSIKYKSQEMPRIHIGAQEEDEYWQFSVEDNGIGIDPEYSELIFKIFKRLHTREEYDGTGIGLAITERIISHHGGRIWVESKFKEGSTFYFTIPKKME